MKWFKHAQEAKVLEEELKQDSKIEIVAHKKATKQEVKEVKQVNKVLNERLERNGFTIKIFLAAGGQKGK